MEEDIKVLEGRINFCKNNKECREELKQCFGCTFEVEEIQAIENLIKGYKELEVINKMQEYRISVIDERELIPKSKVRELQDKYKNKIEKLENKKIWNEPVDTINKNRYTNYYNAYEELLQEGDK